MKPLFLNTPQTLKLHKIQIDRKGGDPRLLDAGRLDSAVMAPKATFDGIFLHRDIFEMAATYLFSVAKNHPFADGNKRAAAFAALVFIELNGWRGDESREFELTAAVLNVASGRMEKAELTKALRRYSRQAS